MNPSKTVMPSQSAFVLIGPPLTGKKEFFYDWAFEGLKSGESVCFVTTDASAENVKKELVAQKFFYGQYENKGMLKFIDCYSHNTDEFLPDTSNIKRIPGPLALNEISIALSEIEREFLKLSENHRIVFNSLSTLLMYCNAEAIARFVQVLIARIKKAGGSVIFTLEEGMHPSNVMVTLEHLMDKIIQVKKENGNVFFKYQDDKDWIPLKNFKN